MSEQLKVSSSPHIRSKETTGNIMLWVIIALLPATFFGIYNFRDTHAWLLVIVTTAAAVLTEYIYEKLMHKNRAPRPRSQQSVFQYRPRLHFSAARPGA